MVGGLGYPSVGTDADEAMAYPAVRLFVQAGRRVQQGFRLVSADAGRGLASVNWLTADR